MNERAAELIERLHLRPHPEGGFYVEVHRSSSVVDALDGRPRRAALTSIYFLLPAGASSRWHRVLSDDPFFYILVIRIKFFRLQSRIKYSEIRCRICSASCRPLPAPVVSGQIKIQ